MTTATTMVALAAVEATQTRMNSCFALGQQAKYSGFERLSEPDRTDGRSLAVLFLSSPFVYFIWFTAVPRWSVPYRSACPSGYRVIGSEGF